ncbi:hypothetical protein [Sphingomonas bacterium]|nr:hypothetical protein [Sphingomonas bacterium]
MRSDVDGRAVDGGSDLRLVIGANLFVLALIGMCQAAYAMIY